MSNANLLGGRIDGKVFINEHDGKYILYGDPSGLKNLSEKLLALANLDQHELAPSQLPNREGFHIHLLLSCTDTTVKQLAVGRLDSKETGDTSWFTSSVIDP